MLQWPALNPLSIHVTFTAIVPGAYPGGQKPKCVKTVLKWLTYELTGWITGKRLKIDEYMMRCVWQAFNRLFIHVTYTAIVTGTYHKHKINLNYNGTTVEVFCWTVIEHGLWYEVRLIRKFDSKISNRPVTFESESSDLNSNRISKLRRSLTITSITFKK